MLSPTSVSFFTTGAHIDDDGDYHPAPVIGPVLRRIWECSYCRARYELVTGQAAACPQCGAGRDQVPM